MWEMFNVFMWEMLNVLMWEMLNVLMWEMFNALMWEIYNVLMWKIQSRFTSRLCMLNIEYFSYIMAVSFIGGENQSIRKKNRHTFSKLSANVVSRTACYLIRIHNHKILWFFFILGTEYQPSYIQEVNRIYNITLTIYRVFIRVHNSLDLRARYSLYQWTDWYWKISINVTSNTLYMTMHIQSNLH
jgi:hypothetical protein